MTFSSRLVSAAVISLMFATGAVAQSTTPAPAPTAAAPKAAPADSKAPVVHSAASLECSKQADAKGLHGKERKKFRSECKKDQSRAK